MVDDEEKRESQKSSRLVKLASKQQHQAVLASTSPDLSPNCYSLARARQLRPRFGKSAGDRGDCRGLAGSGAQASARSISGFNLKLLLHERVMN